MVQSFGPLLKAWRTARGKSQLSLSGDAGVSSRHLSFMETGRSAPSREMVLALAEALEVPLRERNVLLQAAGYAALYPETPLDTPAMVEIRGALTHILEANGIHPTLVVNRRYDILMANHSAQRLVAFFAPDWRGPANVARMLLSPSGLRPSVVNWVEIAAHVVHRVRSELGASQARTAEDEALLAELIAAEGEFARPGKVQKSHSILVPLKLRREDFALDLFTTIATVGTPLDITLQELRIETLFPLDPRARASLQALAG